ncbi:MAG: hypothetical protein KAQ78_03210 [Candidatus Latescibacteria bacterium]|nr:hypothetical protein [Candidatus Latescibacterota bacterium]
MNKKGVVSIILQGIFLVIIMFCTQNIFAQGKTRIEDKLRIPDSGHVQLLTTHDGSMNIGRIIEIGESEITFETDLGKLTISISKIKEIKEISAASIKNGEYWFTNPNATRLFFAPTAYTLKQGKGYFADYYIFFPAFAYGLTDKVTIGGGMSLLPGVDIDKQIFYFTPKVGLKATKDFNLALGALLIKIPEFSDDEDSPDDDSPLIGILYGVSTFGKPDGNVTMGLGFGFVGDELADKPMICFGGEKRLSRRLSLVTENWIFPGFGNPLISCGIRFFGEKLSTDLALMNTLGEDMIFPGVPYIDFVFAF